MQRTSQPWNFNVHISHFTLRLIHSRKPSLAWAESITILYSMNTLEICREEKKSINAL